MDISLAPQTIFFLAGFPITNTFLVTIVVSILLIFLVLFSIRRLEEVPSWPQNIWEIILEEGQGFVAGIAGGGKFAKRIFPLFMTLFLFILMANILPFIPGLNVVSIGGVPLLRTATTDYGLIFSLTILSFVVIQITAIVANGIWGYVGKFLNFRSPMAFFFGLLDIVGELAKVLSLSFRLFGNIFAGEILLAVVFGFVPYLLPVPLYIFLMFTSIIQAGVFSVLVLIFVMMASEKITS